MSAIVERRAESDIIYPESDGQPMAENTLQFQWIVTIQGGLDSLFANDPNVFVAGDLFWYPVEGDPAIRTAPDAMVVFGRPKGHRGSYMQWREDDIPPQVVFEVLSPGNRPPELIRKYDFYRRYGVEEYYIYDPNQGDLSGWRRYDDSWQEIPSLAGWTSPRLGIRFEFENKELVIYRPDGRRFASFVELSQQLDAAERKAEEAKGRAEQARQQAEEARQQAEEARQQANQTREQAERLAAQLRTMGVEPEL